MSSPNRSTSDIEDAFSSMNILNYTSVSSDSFPASAGSSSFNSLENAKDNIIPQVFSSFYNNPYLKDVQAFYAKELPISSPDPITPPAILTPSPVFEIEKCSDKMYLKHHEKQVEDILNYLDELYLHRIERMEEGRINGNKLKTELKEIRTQIIRLQKKRLGQKDKIAFAHYRISDLERIIEKIQAHPRIDKLKSKQVPIPEKLYGSFHRGLPQSNEGKRYTASKPQTLEASHLSKMRFKDQIIKRESVKNLETNIQEKEQKRKPKTNKSKHGKERTKSSQSLKSST
ncbi:hypothetical protein Tco_0410287 [Tanacetum coccineum]